jgi:hypothetical protein
MPRHADGELVVVQCSRLAKKRIKNFAGYTIFYVCNEHAKFFSVCDQDDVGVPTLCRFSKISQKSSASTATTKQSAQ